MLDINHILVVLNKDDTEQPALDRALWLAKALDADLTLMTTTWDSYGDHSSKLSDETKNSIREAMHTRAQSWLDSFVALPECVAIVFTGGINTCQNTIVFPWGCRFHH